jgi:hypothetical protein
MPGHDLCLPEWSVMLANSLAHVRSFPWANAQHGRGLFPAYWASRCSARALPS